MFITPTTVAVADNNCHSAMLTMFNINPSSQHQEYSKHTCSAIHPSWQQTDIASQFWVLH